MHYSLDIHRGHVPCENVADTVHTKGALALAFFEVAQERSRDDGDAFDAFAQSTDSRKAEQVGMLDIVQKDLERKDDMLVSAYTVTRVYQAPKARVDSPRRWSACPGREHARSRRALRSSLDAFAQAGASS